jgi:tetratricopeptide (TPR) repeat protein
MRKLKTLFTVILSFCFSFFLIGQDLKQTFNFGKEQFSYGNSSSAALAFERVLFFSEDSFQLASLNYLGEIELRNGQPEKAANYFNRAYNLCQNRNEAVGYLLKKCASLLEAGKIDFALIDLMSVENEIPDTLLKTRYFLQGIAQFSRLSFSESQQSFLLAFDANDLYNRNKIDSLFLALDNIKGPKPKKARILSMILPGMGQLYAGDIKNGVNSLLLTGTLLALGINTAINLTLLDALMTVAPWFQRYYMGGYNRAENIAAEKFKEKQNRIFLKILSVYDSR